MTPVDPPLRVGPAIAPVGAVGPAIVLDGRLSPQSLSLGQVVGARLLSDPADGRLVAMLDGRPVEVLLPRGARRGDMVRLTVTAEQPRLVLSARGEPQAETVVARGATLPSGTSAGETRERSGPVAGDVRVSAAGQALSRLVADISAAGARQAAGPAAADAPDLPDMRAPLVALPAPARAALAGQIAGALARTFAGSGLFYESHQAQWVAGERSLDALRQEPQGKLAPLPGTAPAAGRALAGMVDPAAVGLVQQQLGALDAGSASWSGLVLPGLHARLTVQEKPQPSEADPPFDPEAGADWSTRLSVTLPRLGAVEARLVLRGDRIQILLAAGAPASADALATARPELAEALAASGLSVQALQVTTS